MTANNTKNPATTTKRGDKPDPANSINAAYLLSKLHSPTNQQTKMQRLKIDVTKIDKTALYKGDKGTYLDVTLLDNRDGTDQYGNDGMIVQDIGKQRREAGEKGPILGNWKFIGQSAPAQAKPSPAPIAAMDDGLDDIPF